MHGPLTSMCVCVCVCVCIYIYIERERERERERECVYGFHLWHYLSFKLEVERPHIWQSPRECCAIFGAIFCL